MALSAASSWGSPQPTESIMGSSRVSSGFAAFVVSSFLGALPAFPHHSLAPYDRDVSRTIEGVVKAYDFANPHVKLSVTVTSTDGSSTDWLFESSSVSRMMARG